MRRALVAFVVAMVSLLSFDVHARGAARFAYTHPVGDRACPDERAMRGLVATHLGYDPFDDGSSVRIQASIERVAGRLLGRIVLTRDGAIVGERNLDAANDCASVAQALALTVAVAIDTLDEAPPHESPSPPATVADAPIAPPSPVATAPAPSPARGSRRAAS